MQTTVVLHVDAKNSFRPKHLCKTSSWNLGKKKGLSLSGESEEKVCWVENDLHDYVANEKCWFYALLLVKTPLH